MKGKRYTTEDEIRILQEADRGEKGVLDICGEANISEVSFHRWKRQFGRMEVNEARRFKELELFILVFHRRHFEMELDEVDNNPLGSFSRNRTIETGMD